MLRTPLFGGQLQRLLSMGDMSAELAVHALRHDPALDPYADIRANLQGQWVFAADPA